MWPPLLHFPPYATHLQTLRPYVPGSGAAFPELLANATARPAPLALFAAMAVHPCNQPGKIMVDKSRKFITLVRLGYAARGLTYMLLGWLAIEAGNRIEAGNQAVFDVLHDWQFGTVILWIIAAGLLAYALFKLASAVADVQRHGPGAKGIALRIGDGASAIAYGILSFAAYEFAVGQKRVAEDGTQESAQGVLAMDFGGLLLGLIGLGFLAGAIMQARSAVTAHFMHRVSPQAPAATRTIGRIGHAARALVFIIVGWSLVQAAWLSRSGEAKGIGQALASLRDQGPLFTLTAIGLMLFGLFSLVLARYRIIPDFSASSLRPKLR